MTTRTSLPALAAILATALLMLFCGASGANAQQNPNCCFYTVDIQNATPPCDNIRLVTRWDCGGTGVTLFKTYTGSGTTIEPIGPPLLPPCPPACKLVSISIDNVNFIGPGQTWTYKIGNCCHVVSFGFDAAGCIYIRITRIPC